MLRLPHYHTVVIHQYEIIINENIFFQLPNKKISLRKMGDSILAGEAMFSLLKQNQTCLAFVFA